MAFFPSKLPISAPPNERIRINTELKLLTDHIKSLCVETQRQKLHSNNGLGRELSLDDTYCLQRKSIQLSIHIIYVSFLLVNKTIAVLMD